MQTNETPAQAETEDRVAHANDNKPDSKLVNGEVFQIDDCAKHPTTHEDLLQICKIVRDA